MAYAGGDELPVKPEPQQSRFYDKGARIELSIAATAATVDVVTTCHALANGAHEDILPTQSCKGVSLILFGQVAAQEGAAYLLHRTGHDRLAHAVRLYSIIGNGRGIIYSKQHGGL